MAHRVATTSDGWKITYIEQDEIPWKLAKDLVRLADSNDPTDVERVLATVIVKWDAKIDGNSILPPKVGKDGTVSPNGLDLLTIRQIRELSGLFMQAGSDPLDQPGISSSTPS